MTDRRRRGASWSSSCFQTSSAFGFLFFMVRSRVGIRGVESRKLRVERKRKNLTQRPRRTRRSQRKKLTVYNLQFTARRRDKDLAPARARRRMRHQKKKGEAAVCPQIHPRVIIAEFKLFASANFNKFNVPGRG